jgi:hypothetical protein
MAAKKGMKSTFAGKEEDLNEDEEMENVIKEFNEYKKSSLEREANLNKQLESLRAENEALKRGVPENIDKEVQGDKIEEFKQKVGPMLRVKDVDESLRREELWRLRFKIIANNLREIKEKCADDKSEVKSQIKQTLDSTLSQLLKYSLYTLLDFAL